MKLKTFKLENFEIALCFMAQAKALRKPKQKIQNFSPSFNFLENMIVGMDISLF